MGLLSTDSANGPGRIVWLASYPKSGNTWLRAVLGHLLCEEPATRDLNDMPVADGIASSRADFDEFAGVDAADLPLDIVDELRPRIYECLSGEATQTLFVKAHDAYLPTRRGEPMFPLLATLGVVHVVRNPLDVAVSLAHHNGVEPEQATAWLCRRDYTVSGSPQRLPEQLRQRILDWSSHTESWLDAPLPRLTLRYEEMLADPLGAFGRIARFCNLRTGADAVAQAVEACRFERLQALEAQQRFKETPRKADRFFRSGRSGDWRRALTPAQAQHICRTHRTLMSRMGYDALIQEIFPCPS